MKVFNYNIWTRFALAGTVFFAFSFLCIEDNSNTSNSNQGPDSCGEGTYWDSAKGSCELTAVPSESDKRDMAASVIINSIWSLYNPNIPGKPGGSISVQNVACPQGGQVTITGTASATNGVNTIDLTYTFTNCKSIEDTGTITFVSGTCRQAGTWQNEVFQQIVYSGTATMYVEIEFWLEFTYEIEYSETDFSISEELQDGDWSYTGTLDGLEISYGTDDPIGSDAETNESDPSDDNPDDNNSNPSGDGNCYSVAGACGACNIQSCCDSGNQCWYNINGQIYNCSGSDCNAAAQSAANYCVSLCF